jgi:hypothetical protein
VFQPWVYHELRRCVFICINYCQVCHHHHISSTDNGPCQPQSIIMQIAYRGTTREWTQCEPTHPPFRYCHIGRPTERGKSLHQCYITIQEQSRRSLWRMPSSGIWKPSSYLTADTLRLHYRDQPVNGMYDLRFSRRWLWRMSSSGIWKPSSYLTADTLRLHYRDQPISCMYDLRFSRRWLWRMPSFGMLRRVNLVITDISEELRASIIRVPRIGEIGTMFAACVGC